MGFLRNIAGTIKHFADRGRDIAGTFKNAVHYGKNIARTISNTPIVGELFQKGLSYIPGIDTISKVAGISGDLAGLAQRGLASVSNSAGEYLSNKRPRPQTMADVSLVAKRLKRT